MTTTILFDLLLYLLYNTIMQRNNKGQFVKGMTPYNFIGTKRNCLLCGNSFPVKGTLRRKKGKFYPHTFSRRA